MAKIPFLNKIAIFLITGIRPIFGLAHCRYQVSCTKFAVWQLQEKGFIEASWTIFKRILSCNPLWK